MIFNTHIEIQLLKSFLFAANFECGSVYSDSILRTSQHKVANLTFRSLRLLQKFRLQSSKMKTCSVLAELFTFTAS